MGRSPFLGVALYERVYEPEQCIKLDAYKCLGDDAEEDIKTQETSGLKRALNLHANKVYHYADQFELQEEELKQKPELKRSEEEQKWIRLIFLRLVRTGKENTDTRQPRTRAELLAIVDRQRDAHQRLDRVIESLIRGRLLVSDKGEQAEVIDLAHEALIDGWKQFVIWRAEDREFRRAAERLEDAQRDWEEAEDKDNTQYLVRGALLAQVRDNFCNISPYLIDEKASK